MEPGDSWQIILLIVLLGLSAFFSASETALMTLSKIRVKHLVSEKVKGAERIQRLLDDPGKLLSSILIGNNVVNIGASALMTSLFIAKLGEAGVGIATAFMTVIVLIFGEITPKSLAAQNSEKVSFMIAKPIAGITYALSPVIKLLSFVTGFVISLLGGKPTGKQVSITEDELRTIVNVSHEEGVLEQEERTMIHNVFEFGDTKAKDVMTPRTDMVSLDCEATYEEVRDMFYTEQFSRIPVHEDSFDNIIGVITLKDFFFNIKNPAHFVLKEQLRKPFFTYEYKMTSELLAEMRVAKTHLAIVLDEYGGTSGIVTIEDLIEEIIGEIEDEYDEEETDIKAIKEDEYVVFGSARIEEVNDMLGLHIESEHYDTIGGFVVDMHGGLPDEGDRIEAGNAIFLIEKVDKNRIESIRIFTVPVYDEEE